MSKKGAALATLPSVGRSSSIVMIMVQYQAAAPQAGRLAAVQDLMEHYRFQPAQSEQDPLV